jgi:hypothetical protein
VWHASVSGFSRQACRYKALQALDGVGDEKLGQWEEIGEKAVHVRRRLTDDEAKMVGGVRDIRGTQEARAIVERLRKELLHVNHEWMYDDAGLKVWL